MSEALEASGVTVPGRLRPTDLRLRAGSLTLLVGPNGAGKTSLLHGLAGVNGAGGMVSIGGLALAGLSPPERIARLAFLPASRELLWPLACRDLVALGLGGRHDEKAVAEALALVDATELGPRRADRLSTGERARVLIARALVARAAVLLLDEPVANLDPRWQLRIMGVLRGEAVRGAAVLASIHDLALARATADRVLVIDQGEIVADGAPSEALSAALLGRVFGVRWSPECGWAAA